MKNYMQPTFELWNATEQDVIRTSVFQEGTFREYERIDFSQLS